MNYDTFLLPDTLGNLTSEHEKLEIINSEHLIKIITYIIISFLTCTILYNGAFYILYTYSNKFRNELTYPEQADCCSRVYSSVHALIVPVGLLYNWFYYSGREDLDVEFFRQASTFFAFSIGYFAFDSVIMVKNRMQLWIIYIIHHIFASLPYFFASMIPGAQYGISVLALAMLVEFTNPLFNVIWVMKMYGLENSRIYTCLIYIAYALWIVVRTICPMYLTYRLWVSVIRVYGFQMMLIPAYGATIFLNIFCMSIFLLILTPNLWTHWSSRKVRREKRSLAKKKILN